MCRRVSNISTAHEGPAAAGGSATRALTALRRGGALLAGLFFLVGALQLLKTGAASLDVLQDGSLLVANPLSTLGLGWLGALLVLSGSPVAATSLALQWGLMKAIDKLKDARTERAKEAARREVLEAMNALEEARKKAARK